MKNFLALLAVLAVLTPTQSWSITGDELFKFCKVEKGFSKGYCAGLIRGTLEGIATMVKSKELKPVLCLPAEMTDEEMIKIVVKYLKANPDTRQFTYAVQIVFAMQEEFPCFSQ